MVWNRKEYKRRARKAVRGNYWPMVAVCFILAFFGCEYTSSTASIHQYDSNITTAEDLVVVQSKKLSNYEVAEDIVRKILNKEEEQGGQTGLMKEFNDIRTSIFDSRTEDRSYIFQVLRALREFVIEHRAATGMIFVLAALLSLAYSFLAANPLIVGKREFFLESSRITDEESKPGIRRIFYSFMGGRYWNTVKIMFFRDLFVGLWSLTIIGGIIKFYEYRPIPFLAAEYPELDRKEIFRLSKEMMRGYKWQLFLMDLSFIGWELLEVATLGLAGIFYAVPYMSAAETQMYLGLKEAAGGKEKVYE
ncbi:DUF975 family protein [Murimonas intestini]|uniref:Uncharacterized protein DUF975 n=1 Tax=Murimonas intestini TaxID=1337051 RepID=A0AB73T673_9FIRM|nr:DUF975 family protein [Murimonas intestini]MCR1841958.1 DUF975 family protein [Murimonas intestini]MCR1865028.1 DUF975 family protein [Murimonas intestini]MCR1885725.1 DUF975 family protein [Murimonas intestini]